MYNPTLSLTTQGRKKAEEVGPGQGAKWAIVSAIYEQGPMTYDEVSEATNVDPQTVNSNVAELIARGYVVAQ
jgi:predicted ArsR family transcriptional regulator